jgi:hypothetical protein
MADIEPKNTAQPNIPQEPSQQPPNPAQEQIVASPVEQEDVMYFSMFGKPDSNNDLEKR